LRNSRSFDLVGRLSDLGYDVEVADPYADRAELKASRGLDLASPDGRAFDLVIGAVAHDDYRKLTAKQLGAMLNSGGTLADIKGIWRGLELEPSIQRCSL
jgi:UDP-N-acetyl-D-glucosamine/UDP-N-acetyl-D-galactosamine dehydrogenase